MKYTHMSDVWTTTGKIFLEVVEVVKLWRHNDDDDDDGEEEEATHQKSDYVCEGSDWNRNSCAEVLMYLYLLTYR